MKFVTLCLCVTVLLLGCMKYTAELYDKVLAVRGLEAIAKIEGSKRQKLFDL